MKLKLARAVRIKTGSPRIVSFEIPADRADEYAELVRRSPDRLDVELATPGRSRSTGAGSQGHHLNGHVQQIANETGNPFDVVKLYVKRQAFARGLPTFTRNGQPVYSIVDGEPLPISEADMTVEQCAWCIEEAHILASELGIILEEA